MMLIDVYLLAAALLESEDGEVDVESLGLGHLADEFLECRPSELRRKMAAILRHERLRLMGYK